MACGVRPNLGFRTKEYDDTARLAKLCGSCGFSAGMASTPLTHTTSSVANQPLLGYASVWSTMGSAIDKGRDMGGNVHVSSAAKESVIANGERIIWPSSFSVDSKEWWKVPPSNRSLPVDQV